MTPSNRWRISYLSGLALIILSILFMGMGNIATVRSDNEPTSIYTRFATPLSSPTNNGGKATWTMKGMTFESKYPAGFEFTLDISSSAGKVSIAKVKWRHSTINPSEIRGFPDANGKYIAQWAPNIYRTLPQWAGVDYWWVVMDEKGNTFETQHGYAEYADNTRQWKRLVSEDAVIHWEASLPAQIGASIADALTQQRPTYLQAWGKLLNYKPHIIVYGSYAPWKEWHPDINEGWIEGETNPEWGSTVQIYFPNEKNALQNLTYGVVLHELEHLYQQTYSPYDTYHKQTWFYEGDATYLELHQYYDYLQRVKDMAANGDLPSLKVAGTVVGDRITYDIGFAFWKYLEVTYGADAHRKVWEQIAKGLPIEQAVDRVTGKLFIDMEKDFRAWLGAKD
jgi:hypothetical protein